MFVALKSKKYHFISRWGGPPAASQSESRYDQQQPISAKLTLDPAAVKEFQPKVVESEQKQIL